MRHVEIIVKLAGHTHQSLRLFSHNFVVSSNMDFVLVGF